MSKTLVDSCKEIFYKIGVPFENWNDLENKQVNRDILLDNEKYKLLKNNVDEIKSHLSSSTLTSLQGTALTKQKWPLLNLIRQVLKIHGFKMSPVRKANGYNKQGKKLFLRFFLIEKM
jgi:hypothetical protein